MGRPGGGYAPGSLRLLECARHQCPDVSHAAGNRDLRSGKRSYLALWPAAHVIPDDGAGMAHPRILRAPLSGDVSDQGRLHSRCQFSGRIFKATARFADDDDQIGVGVGLEQCR